MGKIDLHVHTTVSDGKHSPAAIVQKAVDLKLEVIAISDHDNVGGIIPALNAAAPFPGLTVIPGVELSTDVATGEVHVLGYFIDYLNQDFEANLERMRHSRISRAQKMVEKLNKLGVKIDYARVQQIAGEGTVGRPHIAQAMMEKGYISEFKEAFSRYIGHNGPAYVERDKLTPAEAVELINKTGGLAVLAHPYTSGDVEKTISDLKAVGLVGMEVYYGGYSPEDVTRLLRVADANNLIPTGGTDYHGISEGSEIMMGNVDVPMKTVERLTALAVQRGSRIPVRSTN